MSEFMDECMYGSARGQIDKHASGGSQVVCVEAGCSRRFVTVCKTPSEVKLELDQYHDWSFDPELSRWRCRGCTRAKYEADKAAGRLPGYDVLHYPLAGVASSQPAQVTAADAQAEPVLPTDGTDRLDRFTMAPDPDELAAVAFREMKGFLPVPCSDFESLPPDVRSDLRCLGIAVWNCKGTGCAASSQPAQVTAADA